MPYQTYRLSVTIPGEEKGTKQWKNHLRKNFHLTVSRVSSCPLAPPCDAENLFGRCARKGVASRAPAPPVRLDSLADDVMRGLGRKP